MGGLCKLERWFWELGCPERLKRIFPVQLAEYAVQVGIEKEPAFSWWIPYTLKKRQRIISKIKSKYWQRAHTYGIIIPKTVREALEFDKENENDYWDNAIKLEMENVTVAFELYGGDTEKLICYNPVGTHLIFDVKLGENFKRKARLVADGHHTKTPPSLTYSSVVSKDSAKICLLLAALNGL